MDTSTLVRLGLMFLHFVAVAVAVGAVLREDWRLLSGRLDVTALAQTRRVVFYALAVLWISGTGIVWIDTSGFDLSILTGKPKLLAKLLVVGVLTANGAVLHRFAFPMFGYPQRDPRTASGFLAIVGAVSSVSWLFAIFVGVGQPVASILGFSGFVSLYLIALGGGITVALVSVRPRIEQLLLQVELGSAGPARTALAPLSDVEAFRTSGPSADT
jgi:hypothetical protein